VAGVLLAALTVLALGCQVLITRRA
jgi:hypothetical protein